MKLSTTDIVKSIQDGLLSFPISDFNENDELNATTFGERIAWFLVHDISAIFVAGGTGEFFSLSVEEYKQIVEITTNTVQNKVPVFSGIGRSIPEAIKFASIAQDAGVDALLLFPPYLVDGPQEGIYHYAKSIIQQVNLPVIYYNRSNGFLSAKYIKKLAMECENLIGLKDGTGNIQELNDIIKTVGDRLSYIGGVPTAEIISEAYLSIGVNTYSSAAFNFVPKLANHFYKSLREGNKEQVTMILKEFFIPFVRLRSKQKGYAVSLIKAGANIIGKSAGNVRSPLTMPSDEETNELAAIIKKGEALVP